MKLTNLKMELEPKTTLFKEEADAIMAVVRDTLKRDAAKIKDGSFLLYGRADDGDELQEILSFDFENGPTVDFDTSHGAVIDSHTVADNILRQDLKNDHIIAGGYISYFCDSPIFLSLKTTYGRFSCACYAGDLNYYNMARVYCAVAQAIACMGLEDEMLQKSCDQIFSAETYQYADIGQIRLRVKNLFRKCKLAELKTWKKWHDASASVLTLFFQ